MDLYSAEKFGVLLPSLLRVASVNSDTIVNEGFRGVRVCIDVTVDAESASIVATLVSLDPATKKATTLLVSPAIAAVGTTFMTVYPGATLSANVVASLPLGRLWRLQIVAADGDDLTYSASYEYLY